MINTLLTMSLTGSAVALAWLAVDKLFRDRLSALWHDRILRLALFFMLVPVGRLWAAARELVTDFLTGRTVDVPAVMPVNPALDLPASIPGAIVTPNVVPDIPVMPPVAQSAAVSVSVDVFWLLTLIWGLGAATVLCYKLWCYWQFKKLLGKERRPLSQEGMEVFWDCKAELGVSGVVGIFVNPAVPTPLATGLIWPVILLPDESLEREELRYLLIHELTHIRRRDLWVRFFALCALVIHWYNPLMHLLNHRIKERSEQSCDEQVARSMSKEERLAYGSMLLKMVTNPTIGPSEWAVTLSTKESIQQRLSRVLKAGHFTRMDKAVAVVVAAGLLICGTVVACSMREPLAVEVPGQEGSLPEPGTQEVQLPDTLITPGGDKPSQPVIDLPAANRPEAEATSESSEELPEIEVSEEQGSVAVEPMITPAPENAPETMTIGAVEYETYVDEHGVVRLKDAVGDVKYLDLYRLTLMDTLVDGKYPVNSRGETYGYAELADFVGQEPDLICVYKRSDMGMESRGYVAREDYYADFSDPEVAARYQLVDANWLNLPMESNSREWAIPLYDAERNVIGSYGIEYGKENDPALQGELIEELERASVEMKQEVSDDRKEGGGFVQEPGSEKFAVIRDGTGAEVKIYLSNHGKYLIPNDVSILDSANWPDALWEALPDGAYPVNSKGESYGSMVWKTYLQHEPDLISAKGIHGEPGYVWWEDMEIQFETAQDLDKVAWTDEGFLIPLYDAEHNPIGTYCQRTGYRINGMELNQNTVEEIRAFLSQ